MGPTSVFFDRKLLLYGSTDDQTLDIKAMKIDWMSDYYFLSKYLCF